MRGRYGPNSVSWYRQYAYIYLEVGGAEMADGAVVTTWATLVEPDLPVYEWQADAWGNMTQVQVGTTAQPGATRTETAECRVIYRTGTSDAPHTNAEYDDVDVRTYRGKLMDNTFTFIGTSNVWEKPVTFYEDRYQQTHTV